MTTLFNKKLINEIRQSTFGRIEFRIPKKDLNIVLPFIEKYDCEILLTDGIYHIIVHNPINDHYNTNLLAELHDITFERLSNLSINESGGLGMSNITMKYQNVRHCDEPYFEQYGYENIGIYQQEKLDEYFSNLHEQKKLNEQEIEEYS